MGIIEFVVFGLIVYFGYMKHEEKEPYVNWSWWKVFTPFWIYLVIITLIMVVVGVGFGVFALII